MILNIRLQATSQKHHYQTKIKWWLKEIWVANPIVLHDSIPNVAQPLAYYNAILCSCIDHLQQLIERKLFPLDKTHWCRKQFLERIWYCLMKPEPRRGRTCIDACLLIHRVLTKIAFKCCSIYIIFLHIHISFYI